MTGHLGQILRVYILAQYHGPVDHKIYVYMFIDCGT